MREMLAHTVHLANGGAAFQQGLVDALLSARSRPSAGRVSRAEPPPPEIRHSTRSSRSALCVSASTCARQPASRRHPARGERPNEFDTLRQSLGARRNMVVARDQAGTAALLRPQRFKRLAHRTAGLCRRPAPRYGALGGGGRCCPMLCRELCAAPPRGSQMSKKAWGSRRAGTGLWSCAVSLYECIAGFKVEWWRTFPYSSTKLYIQLPSPKAMMACMETSTTSFIVENPDPRHRRGAPPGCPAPSWPSKSWRITLVSRARWCARPVPTVAKPAHRWSRRAVHLWSRPRWPRARQVFAVRRMLRPRWCAPSWPRARRPRSAAKRRQHVGRREKAMERGT